MFGYLLGVSAGPELEENARKSIHLTGVSASMNKIGLTSPLCMLFEKHCSFVVPYLCYYCVFYMLSEYLCIFIISQNNPKNILYPF